MVYNKQCQAKLERWYNYCKFKPIHILVIERIYANVWKERGYREIAGQIRRERDAQWWEAMKTVAGKKEKAGRRDTGASTQGPTEERRRLHGRGVVL